MGLLPDTQNCGLRMRRECRERFPRHRGLAIPACITARASRAWCMSGSLTSGFLWSRWREKRSRPSRCMRNLQFYVSGKWPMGWTIFDCGRAFSLHGEVMENSLKSLMKPAHHGEKGNPNSWNPRSKDNGSLQKMMDQTYMLHNFFDSLPTKWYGGDFETHIDSWIRRTISRRWNFRVHFVEKCVCLD